MCENKNKVVFFFCFFAVLFASLEMMIKMLLCKDCSKVIS